MSIYYQILYVLVVLSVCEMLCTCSEKKTVLTVTIRGKQQIVKIGRCIAFIIGVVLIVIALMRSQDVGRDLINYVRRFQNIAGAASWSELKTLANAYSFEIGFVLFCKVLSFFSVNTTFFIIVTSVIVGIGFLVIIKKSPMPITTWMMIYCFGIWGNSLNVVRQFLALTILAVSIRFIEKRKLVKFLLLVLLAATIHSTAILFVLMYFFHINPINVKFMRRFLIVCACMILFGVKLIEVVISRTSFAWYLLRNDGSGQATLCFLLIIFVFAYVMKSRVGIVDSNFNIWIGAVAVAIVLNIFALRWGIFARAMKYFLPFIMLLITDMLYSLKKQKLAFFCVGLAVMIFFVVYFNIIIMGKTALPDGWLVYKTVT